jgi:iron complex transport system substrate-binding protein
VPTRPKVGVSSPAALVTPLNVYVSMLPNDTSGLPRAAALLPFLSELVCDIGLSSRLVAVSHECDASPALASLPVVTRSKLQPECPTSQVSALAHSTTISELDCGEIAAGWRAATARDAMPESASAVVAARLCSFYVTDAQALVAAAPSVVLTHIATQRTPMEPCEEQVGAALNSLSVGAPISVTSLDASTVSEVCAAAHVVACALGTPTAAQPAIRQTKLRVEQVRRSALKRFPELPLGYAANARPRPLVAVIQWADPLYVAGDWVPEVVEAAGGRNAFCRPGGPSVAIDVQQLCEVDVIVIAVCAVGKEGATAIATAFWSANAAVLASCTAHVVVVDATRLFSRSSLSCVADSCEVMHDILASNIDGPICCTSHYWQTYQAPRRNHACAPTRRAADKYSAAASF